MGTLTREKMGVEYDASQQPFPGAGDPTGWPGSNIRDDHSNVPLLLHPPPSRPDYGCLAPPSRSDYGCLAPPSAPDYGNADCWKRSRSRACSRHSSSDSMGPFEQFASPHMMMSTSFSPHSSGSGEFALPSPMPQFGSLPPPMVVQGVAPEVVESIRADIIAQAEEVFSEKRAVYDKKLHLARVRVAELEKRTKRAEQEGDDMSTKLTLVEVQKAEVEKARDIVEEKLSRIAEGACDLDRVRDLEAEVAQLRSENQETESLKKTVMTLANELKRRMKEDGTSLHLSLLEEAADSPEDTDYVTDSRSGSDSE